MKHLISVILILATLNLYGQGNTLSGYVRDASNGETLIGASVVVSGTNQGVVTNVYGFYSLTLEPNTYDIEFRYIGYENISESVDLTSENQRLDVELPFESQELEEVVVTAEPEDINVSGIQMSTNRLDMKTIEKMPAFLGEADVIKSIQLLPGVSTVGEGASGFNVRGGGVGQNMVVLDEAPVYQSSHLLGFFSVFNPDAVKDVKLIKGGIPARYGGRISSVLDIRMKEGNTKGFSGQGGIGTVFSRLALEGPIIKDKASFIIAGRRSYADILARPFTDALDDGAALFFYDLTAKANWNINKNNRVYVSGYFGNDVFKFDASQGISWGNATTTVRWNHIFNDKLFSNFTVFYSDYTYSLEFGDDKNDRFTWNSRIRNFDVKPEFTYFLNLNNEISFGGEFSRLRFEPANAGGINNGETFDITLPEKYAWESAAYISNDQKIGDNIQLQYGVRYSRYSLVGPGTAYMFGDTIPGIRKPILAEVEYNSGEDIATYNNLEPRASIKYQIDPYNSIKMSYNRTNQYIHLISNTTASNPLDVWTPSSNNLKPQAGDQIAIGWFRNFGLNNDIEFSVETYYKATRDQIDYIDDAELLINEYLEGDVLSGDGRAYGLELFAKKNTGAFTGWVSYTLAKTELKVEGINNFDWYPTRFDQRHNFKMAAFYETKSRWTLSANFSLLTGTPTNFPSDRYTQQNYVIPHIADGSRNATRIPMFHRLDLSATLQGKKINKKGETKKFTSYWVFSIYNVYGRRNPFSIYFSQQDQRVFGQNQTNTEAWRVSIIGAVVPAISYNFNF